MTEFMPVSPAGERATHVSNSGTAESNAIELPDLGHYAARGLLPTIPAEVNDAITAHQRVVRQYRKARADKSAAEAVIRNGQAAISKAIYEAVINDAGPEPEAQARADLEAARRTADDTSGAFVGYIKALNTVTGNAMRAIEEWTPDAIAHLAGPMTKTAEQVDKARAAYEKAVAAHRELEAIANWLSGVELKGGATFPNPYALVTLDPDDDPTTK